MGWSLGVVLEVPHMGVSAFFCPKGKVALRVDRSQLGTGSLYMARKGFFFFFFFRTTVLSGLGLVQESRVHSIFIFSLCLRTFSLPVLCFISKRGDF